MKKLLLSLLLLISSFILTACVSSRVANLNNIIWKEDEYFNIIVTSEHLQEKEDPGCATITLFGQTYNCHIGMWNMGFQIIPSDEMGHHYESIFLDEYDCTSKEGKIVEFLVGTYDNPKKVKDKEYKYTVKMYLRSGQYVDVCKAKGIEYPEVITLHGYKAN